MCQFGVCVSEEVVHGDGGHTTGGTSWTVLVYMVADNNLEEASVADLEEMAAVGGSAGLRFVVQVDRSKGYSTASLPGIGNWTTAKRLVVDAGGMHEVSDLGEVDMTDPAVLADFIAWGNAAFPADRHMLVFWDHGGGWTGFGQDETTPGGPLLSLATVKQGVARGLQSAALVRFDVIAFDACLMATYEVARVLSPFGEYLLASEESEPGHGWDYRAFAKVRDNPSRAPVDVASDVIDGFFAQGTQQHSGADLTQSLIDLTLVDTLDTALGKFATRLAGVDASQIGSVGQARSSAQRFGKTAQVEQEPQLVDLGSFAGLLGSTTNVADSEAGTLRSAIQSVVLRLRNGNAARDASGLSIYFPLFRSLYDAHYDDLPELAGWRAFLANYYSGGAGLAHPVDLPDSGTLAWVDGAAELSVDVTSAALQDIVQLRGYGGVPDTSDAFAYTYSAFPVGFTGTTLTATWYGEVGSLTQGSQSVIGCLDYYQDTESGDFYVEVPFYYTAPSGDVSYVVLNDIVLPGGTLAGDRVWFQYTDDSVGELYVEPGSQLVPLVAYMTQTGLEWQESEVVFDPTQPLTFDIAFVVDALEPGTNVYIELDAWDYAGNQDYVGGTLAIPGGATGCGDVSEVGYCDGGTVVYCEADTVKRIDCAADGQECGFDEAAGYYDCLQPATGCGDVDEVGVCDGDVLYYCDQAQLYYIDCGAEGLSCAFDEQNGYYDCF
ncbi:MAG: clostripain-related cysteine peptidase [Myxococcota bacterium]